MASASGSTWTYDWLLERLSELDRLYGLMPLRHWRGGAGIILRHDVDMNLTMAHRLALQEAEKGLRGSYFILVTAELYNVSSVANRRLLAEMHASGMEIALHFDPSIYPTSDEQELSAHARDEAKILEDICSTRVNSVSLHNPSVKNEFPILPGWDNAYDQAIFSPDVYLSDSRMIFRHDITNFFRGARENIHQLTLHPMHYSDQGRFYPAPQLEAIGEFARNLDAFFQVNSTYQAAVGSNLFDHIAKSARNWTESTE